MAAKSCRGSTLASRGYIELFVANVTRAGQKLFEHIEAVRGTTGLLAITETHLRGEDVARAAAKIEGLGFSSFWTQAQLTGKGGNHGGAAVFADKRILVSPLHSEPGRLGESALDLQYDDIVPVIVTIGSITFLLVTVYFWSSIGLLGPNCLKLTKLAATLASHALPWLIVGDWNVEPMTLTKSAWFSYVGGVLVLPTDTEITCTQGRGSLLDYGVASAAMFKIIHWCRCDNSVTWKPHLGVG